MNTITETIIWIVGLTLFLIYIAWFIDSINELKKYEKETSRYLEQINNLLVTLAKDKFNINVKQENNKNRELKKNSHEK